MFILNQLFVLHAKKPYTMYPQKKKGICFKCAFSWTIVIIDLQSCELDIGASPSFCSEERKAFEEHYTACQQSFSPSMLLNIQSSLHQHKSDYHKSKKKHKSLERTNRSFISSTPIRDGRATTFSPLTKTHDVPYDSYRDSGYLTRVQCFFTNS